MKLLPKILPLAALCGLPLFGLTDRASGQDVDTVALYKKVVDSAVFIVTPLKGGHAEGSGSLLDAEKRYILTNYHVVDEEDYVYCQFPVHLKDDAIMTEKKKYIERIPAGQAPKGKVLYRDKTRDLALVQLDKLPATARAIKLAPKSTDVGTTTWNIGSPGAVSHVFSITEGKVRAVGNEDFPVGGGGEILHIRCKMVTATNPTNPGDSGGPLVDREGRQVAVTESGNRTAQNVNRFVDVEEVRAFLKEKKIILKDDAGTKEEIHQPPKKGGPVIKTPDAATPPAKDPPKTVVNPPEKKADPAVETPAVSPEAEKSAAQLLQRANLFKDGEDNLPVYKAKLKEVFTKYPGTAAAKEAKKILDGLK